LFTVFRSGGTNRYGNEAADVEVVTGAVGGVGLAEPTTLSRANRIPSPPRFTMAGQGFVGRGPIADMSVSPRGLVFVTNQIDNSVSQLQPGTLAVAATHSGTNEPFVITTTDARAFVSTAFAAYDAVTVIEATTGAIVETYPLAGTVRDLAVSPDGRRVYVARTGMDGADAAVIDIVTGAVSTIDLDTRGETTAEAITISRDGAWLYVASADHLGSELVAIDTRDHRVAGWCGFAAAVRSIAVSPDGATVYVGGHDAEIGAHVDIVEVRTCHVTNTVAIGGPVTQLVLSSGGERLYVVNGMQIAVMCTATREIIDAVSLDAEPTCIAESCDGKRIFVADYDGWVTAYSVGVLDLPMAELERL
jgi:DNA-binding beta-propeller fold protein YncE